MSLKIVLQHQASECGIACLAMISQYWNGKHNLDSLRELVNISIAGLNMSNLADYAEKIGLSPRAVKVELKENIDKLPFQHPVILHWNMNHFVVLKKQTKSGFIIFDPAIGVVFVKNEDFLKKFTGISLELKPNSLFEFGSDKSRSNNIKKIFNGIENYRTKMLAMLSLTFLTELVFYSIPFSVQFLTSNLLARVDITTKTLFLVLLFSIFLVLTSFLATEIRNKLLINIAANLGYTGSRNILSKLFKLPLEYFEKRFVGDVVSRVNSMESIRNLINPSLVVSIIEGMSSFILFGLLFFINMNLTLLGLIPIILFFLYRYSIQERMFSQKNERTVLYSQMTGHLYQNVRGISTIKLNSLESTRLSSWSNELIQSEAILGKFNLYKFRNDSLIFIIEKGDLLLTLILGALLVINNQISLASFTAIMVVRPLLLRRALVLINTLFELKLLRVYFGRMDDIVSTSNEVLFNSITKCNFGEKTFKLELKEVGFRYAHNLPLVLDKLNISFVAGKSTAITAYSGAGKTTIVKLLCGLVQPSEGAVTVNNIKLDSSNLLEYRKHIGTVMQDDQIFSGTFLENITGFALDIDYELVEQVLVLTVLTELIQDLPMGLNTLLTDLGSSLSGGQKQRLILARALYRKPKVLLLDEATSHLDTKTEKKVVKNLKKLGITIIHVAHRKQTIELADFIVQID